MPDRSILPPPEVRCWGPTAWRGTFGTSSTDQLSRRMANRRWRESESSSRDPVQSQMANGRNNLPIFHLPSIICLDGIGAPLALPPLAACILALLSPLPTSGQPTDLPTSFPG